MKISGESSASGSRLRCFTTRLLPEQRNLGPLALHFRRSLHVALRRPVRMRRAPRNVRQASSLSRLRKRATQEDIDKLEACRTFSEEEIWQKRNAHAQTLNVWKARRSGSTSRCIWKRPAWTKRPARPIMFANTAAGPGRKRSLEALPRSHGWRPSIMFEQRGLHFPFAI